MVKDIVKDIDILKQKSVKATNDEEINEVIRDLIDTANAHKDRCVGLSAIQIGVPIRVCVVFDGNKFVPFVNPVIVKCGKKYIAEEGCMSLEGTRKVTRCNIVDVVYFKKKTFAKETYSGFTAQILQHELDHFDGKLI